MLKTKFPIFLLIYSNNKFLIRSNKLHINATVPNNTLINTDFLILSLSTYRNILKKLEYYGYYDLLL